MKTAEQPEALGFDPDRLARVYRFLDEATGTGRLPAAAIQIVRGGVALPARAFGRQYLTADSPPARPDTIFLTASLTKPVTVTAVMLLVEQGRILLDDPVASIIPEFAVNGKEAVTIRHLMTHTSGLPDMLPDDRRLRAEQAPLAEFVRRICLLPLDFTPGTNVQYQSCGIAMLGAVAEHLTGQPLPEFMRQMIFEPLGMPNSALGAQELPTERIAQVNVSDEMRGTNWGWNTPYWHQFAAPWGGMFSTVADICRFAQLFLDGGAYNGMRILAPATVQAMIADQTAALPHLSAQVRATNSWGLGWRRQPPGEWSYWGNLLAPGSYGHGGATGTVLWIDPQRKLVCALFTTQPSALSEGLLGRCSNLVMASVL
jgi:CubicO group peptidase (beta-lactamase class C family)